MAGYSGTPLVKKLGIQSQFRAVCLHLPAEIKAELRDLHVSRAGGNEPLDFAMIFIKSEAELRKQFPLFARQLAPAGMLWVSWPKKSSRVKTDVTENVVRKIGLEAGLVDVKVCAVSEVWSGLKFVIRVKDREKRG